MPGEARVVYCSEVALLFLRLGTISFGGPAAHIAMMEDEVVKRRKWITHEYFLDLLGATNIIPGPNSTEMGIHIGYVRAGWKGLVLAGVCFILPAVAISIVFAHLYVICMVRFRKSIVLSGESDLRLSPLSSPQ